MRLRYYSRWEDKASQMGGQSCRQRAQRDAQLDILRSECSAHWTQLTTHRSKRQFPVGDHLIGACRPGTRVSGLGAACRCRDRRKLISVA